MAGIVKVNSVQLGDSAIDAQNFQLRTNVDGTAKLARGAAGTLGDIFTISASGVITAAGLVANSGEVVQIVTRLDPGSTNYLNTTPTNTTGSLINFTPKNAASSLLIECSFQGLCAYQASTNVTSFFRMYEGTVSTPIGVNDMPMNVQISPGGAYSYSPVTIRAVVPNTALTTRIFGLYAYSSGAPTLGSGATSQVWSITEIKN